MLDVGDIWYQLTPLPMILSRRNLGLKGDPPGSLGGRAVKEGEESLLLPDHTEDNVVISGVHVHTNIKEGTSGELENVWKLKIFENPSFLSSVQLGLFIRPLEWLD